MTRISLDGVWDIETDQGRSEATVPGLATDPAAVNATPLRCRRRVTLPAGDWTHATLTLNGARFMPRVLVDDVEASRAAGGMAPTHHLLAPPAVAPGRDVELTVELAGLDATPADDASRVPPADRWRSNVSSCLWDGVSLRTHRGARLTRIIPHADPANGNAVIRWQLERLGSDAPLRLQVEVLDQSGAVRVEETFDTGGDAGRVSLDLQGRCRAWSPQEPNLYRLRVSLLDDAGVVDADEMNFAPRSFAVDGLGFVLNGSPITLRAGSVVCHRWVRDAEARRLGFDVDWFEANIARRLRDHGANTLRFHLGSPPEALLDLCDRLGLCVQLEWLFFHGMAASLDSLLEQWRSWLDLAMRHPCVVLLHPWNETEGDELDTAFEALRRLAPEYPPLVVAHRDVTHVHKYWWGLFENLGLYYDSADQFPQPIMVDEFGGNYLDGACNPGGYPTLRESFLRFLGRGHTAGQRLWLHTAANAKVAEYWRRIGAAGFSPFCIAGSWEDGNHHFLGPLAEGNPKPVWDALTAAYAPQSVSIDLWDRTFAPGRTIDLALVFFNDTPSPCTLSAAVEVVRDGHAVRRVEVNAAVEPHARAPQTLPLPMPRVDGDYQLRATLLHAVPGVTRPIVSDWDVRVLTPQVPDALRGGRIGVDVGDGELRAMLTAVGLDICDLHDPTADAVVTGRGIWEELAEGHPGVASAIEAAIGRGCGVVMLDVGPRPLGQGYLSGGDLGPLQGAMWIRDPGATDYELPMGVSLRFVEMPEPESHIHPAEGAEALYANLPREATWLWNGYRGGLIVPASDLRPAGLSQQAFVAQWTARGADADAIRGDGCLAYELAGFYAFSQGPSKPVQEELRRRVRFLVDDAPALANAINPNAPIVVHDLSEGYRLAASGQARRLTPLIVCGKNLTRTSVLAIDFAEGCGRLVLSQLLTQGRLAEGFGTPGHYGIRHDPAAVQLTLNLIEAAIRH